MGVSLQGILLRISAAFALVSLTYDTAALRVFLPFTKRMLFLVGCEAGRGISETFLRLVELEERCLTGVISCIWVTMVG